MLNIILTATDKTSANPWPTYLMLGIIIIAFVAMSAFSRRSQKKRQEETAKIHNALKPGNKVKTIGGICGVVVEVCPEEGTFVLETGSETAGKSYIKFDRQAVYQTDAVAEEAPATEEVVETPVEEVATEEVVETPVEETATEEVVETPVEETATEEVATEE